MKPRIILIEDAMGFVLPVKIIPVAGPGWCIRSEIVHLLPEGNTYQVDTYKFKDSEVVYKENKGD